MYDVTALGEVLIDFACLDVDGSGYPTMKANPGGAPCNFLAALSAYGAKTAFLGKVGADAFGNMLLQARRRFDYIFLDAPAGVDAGFRLVSTLADRFLLVTGPGPAAIRDAARVGDLLELAGKDQIRLIVNRVDREMLSMVRLTIDDVMDSTGLPLAGIVPEDPDVTLAAAFGMPVLKFARRGDASKAFRRIANRLQGFTTPVKLR